MSNSVNAGSELIVAPHEIEQKSFEIITEELGGKTFPPVMDEVVKRVIHATADFSFADTLKVSDGPIESAMNALRAGATIVTDTNMARAGISKPALAKLGCNAQCYMADETVMRAAKEQHTTRAVACMDKASEVQGPLIIAIGNAPTALLHLCDLIAQGAINPALVIGVPVGFVNVVESKQHLQKSTVPFIVAEGRKGGSTVACAICNALLYHITRNE